MPSSSATTRRAPTRCCSTSPRCSRAESQGRGPPRPPRSGRGWGLQVSHRADRARFPRDRPRACGKDLRKYLSTGELIGRAGDKHGLDPAAADRAAALPSSARTPRARAAARRARGRTDRPTARAQRGRGRRRAGDQAGQHILEVEVELDELAEMLGDELELPNIEPRGN